MNKLLLIYGILLPIMIITAAISRTILIGWFVVMSFIAVFHDFLFENNKAIEG